MKRLGLAKTARWLRETLYNTSIEEKRIEDGKAEMKKRSGYGRSKNVRISHFHPSITFHPHVSQKDISLALLFGQRLRIFGVRIKV